MLSHFCDWLAATPLSQAFQALSWFVPIVQTTHILCVALVMTSIGVLDFKMLGIAGRSQSLASMVGSALPFIWGGLAVLLCTGCLLTITEPVRELMNFAFRAKMIMVLVLAGMVLLIQRRLQRDPQYWGQTRLRRKIARAIGAVSLLLAVGIVTAGRWIAYLV